MALTGNFTIQLGYPDQETIYFTDTTEYGGDEIEASEVFKTVISLKAPGATAYTVLSITDYLPGAGELTITCDDYDPEEEDESTTTTPCDSCPESPLTSCAGVTPTCFVDGCWSIKYDIYSDADTVEATVTINNLFYGQCVEALVAIGKKIFNGVTYCNDKKYIALWYEAVKDLDYVKLTAAVDGCDCDCAASGIASVQKKIIALQIDPQW